MEARGPGEGKAAQELCFEHLFTGRAWLRGARVAITADGTIASVAEGTAPDRLRISGCALPGIPNVHSHAHQRAMAGLAERSSPSGSDSFWSWRERMYRHLGRMSPEQLEAIAAQAYLEMLEAGYTAVGEFQYLHHDPRGAPYAEPAEMSLRCLEAARRVGIGITCLPALYTQGGFGDRPLTEGQRRFGNTAEGLLHIVETLIGQGGTEIATGIAPHSLRAVSPQALADVLAAFGGRGPVHIHVAEQQREVMECQAWSGRRPVEWLLDHAPVDAGWCLIHATHISDEELGRLAASGAVAGLCPTTEANLGDGVFRAVAYLSAGGRLAIGSDSHVSISPVEELRWLEYGQRLAHGARSLLAGGGDRSTGRALLEAVLAGGARACGRPIGEIAPGRRADFVVLDTAHPLLCGRSGDPWLDSFVFAGNRSVVREVWVGGRRVVEDGRHPLRREVARRFETHLTALRAEAA